MSTFSFGFTTHLTQADPEVTPALPETRALFADPEPTTYVGNGGITTQQERPKLWGAWSGPRFQRFTPPMPEPLPQVPVAPAVRVLRVADHWLRERPVRASRPIVPYTRCAKSTQAHMTREQQKAFLAEARQRLVVTRRDLAGMIGVPEGLVRGWVGGVTAMHTEHVDRINALLAAHEAAS